MSGPVEVHVPGGHVERGSGHAEREIHEGALEVDTSTTLMIILSFTTSPAGSFDVYQRRAMTHRDRPLADSDRG